MSTINGEIAQRQNVDEEVVAVSVPPALLDCCQSWLIQKVMNLAVYTNSSLLPSSKREEARKNAALLKSWGGESLDVITPSGYCLEAMVFKRGKQKDFQKDNDIQYLADYFEFPSPLCETQSTRASVLLFPGAGGVFGCNLSRIARFLDLGFHVYAFNYPGMGESEGETCRQNILEAAEEMYALIRDEHGSNEPLLLFGNSLGCGPASILAERYAETNLALLLDCPNAKLDKLVADFVGDHFGFGTGPLAACLVRRGHNFDTCQHIANYSGPLRVIYAQEDEMVPFAHSQQVAEAWPGSQDGSPLIAMPGGHWGGTSWRNSKSPLVQLAFEKALQELGMVQSNQDNS